MHPNDPKLRSFVEVDPSSHFAIQNLPYGVFTTPTATKRRIGVAIGDFVLDLSVLELERLIQPAASGTVFSQPTINDFMSLGPQTWSRVRTRISELLRHDNPELRDSEALRRRALLPRDSVTLHLPLEVTLRISILRRSTRPMLAPCFETRTTRFSRIGYTFRSAITGGRRRW
jgi:fumarylacetoacetase